ncbi:MAG: hypothetical protein LOD92_07375 [Bacillales bacterium]
MKKPFKLLLIVLSLLIISSCSKNERKDPYELVETYVDLWQEYNFTKMYDMLSETTKQQYKTEDFIDRYEKIYQDLGIQNLSISILESEYEEEDTAVSFPIQVKMDSIAGPIEFTEEIVLELVVDEETEEENWFVHWNPGLIFPQLKDGGKIKIERIEAKRGEILDRNDVVDDVADFLARIVGVELGKLRKIDRVDQRRENLALRIVIGFAPLVLDRSCRRVRSRRHLRRDYPLPVQGRSRRSRLCLRRRRGSCRLW